MAKESVHKKKERVRPPRVHISYEVELNGAQVMKELPFVTGVLADLSGHPKKPLGRLKDRKFVEIDRDNFDEVLGSIKPRLAFKVEDKLGTGGGELAVELELEKLADFNPESVVQQVQPLNKLLEVRNQLKDLLSRTEGNDRLEELLTAILESSEVRDKLKEAVKSEEAGGGAHDAPGEQATQGQPTEGES